MRHVTDKRVELFDVIITPVAYKADNEKQFETSVNAESVAPNIESY